MSWTTERYARVCYAMRKLLEPFLGEEIKAERVDPMHVPQATGEHREVRQHLKWMLDRIPEFASEGRELKASRWIGFVQGAAWGLGMTPIEAMKHVNLRSECNECGGNPELQPCPVCAST